MGEVSHVSDLPLAVIGGGPGWLVVLVPLFLFALGIPGFFCFLIRLSIARNVVGFSAKRLLAIGVTELIAATVLALIALGSTPALLVFLLVLLTGISLGCHLLVLLVQVDDPPAEGDVQAGSRVLRLVLMTLVFPVLAALAYLVCIRGFLQ